MIESQASAYKLDGVSDTVEPKPKKAKKVKDYTGLSSTTTAPGPSNGPSDHPSGKVDKKRPKTAVYVSNLAPNTTITELFETFSKCGVILEDPASSKPRIKMYTDAQGISKGDALVIYYKPESVELAVTLYDETALRPDEPGRLMRVTAAVFSEKSEGKPKADKVDKSALRRTFAKMDKKLEWFDDEVSVKAQRLVILKHMFTLQELEDDPTLLLDLKEDVLSECAKLGEVTNVVLFDLEEDGIMTVRFKNPDGALKCIQLMHGRFFSGRQVEARLSNGKEKFRQSKMEETEEDEQKRMEKYEAWLESNK